MRSFFKLWMIVAFLVLAGIIAPRISYAGTEPYENFLKGKIQKKDTLLVKDEKFKNPSFNWSDITNIAVKNTITLRLIDETAMQQSFHCEMDLKVQYYTSPDQDSATVIKDVKLKVNYNKTAGAAYKITDSYSFTGAYWVKITVLRVYSPELGANLPPNLQLSSNIVIDRAYKFKPHDKLKAQASFVTAASAGTSAAKSNSTLAVKALSATTTSGISNMQLQLTWPHISGATEYDLEWTTVDNGSSNMSVITSMLNGNGTNVLADSLNKVFRNNATRVTISGTEGYNISLMYNDDYLAVRLRQVSYDATGIRLEGDWDYTLGVVNKYAVFDIGGYWHQPNLNWQYSASFAEDAKKKEVVSYFDGTLRGRQSVTISNSDNIPIAQESIYDEFGRPVVSILPAPFKDASGVTYLHYNQNLNLASTGTPYSFSNIHDSSCEIFADSVVNTSGAGQYYSTNSSFKNDNTINKFIPQAEGYPLSVTQYTPDNTGRIKLQGGVGLLFQPGLNGSNASHTTKYYYGKPDQWELDQLFGNDVGYAEHYQKNMVVDPNGQISISYLNASGKTIATALTGNSPNNVIALLSNSSTVPPKAQNIHLLKPEQFVYNNTDLKLTATTTYLASVTGAATFKYNIEQLVNSYPGNYSICSHCYYDLSIKILDDCNQTLYATTTPLPIGALNDTSCTKPVNYADSIKTTIPQIGEYYITFELALSKTAIENYVSLFILKGQQKGLINNELSFLKSYFNKMDFSGCLSDCSTALQTLGDSTSFRNMFRSKISNTGVTVTDTIGLDKYIYTKWDSLHVIANAAWQNCNLAPCSDKQAIMEQDISPGGQYALFDSQNAPLEVDINVLYNDWRFVFPVKPNTDPLYKQELITRTDGSTTSPYDAGFTDNDKVTYWKDAWAVKFLPYHPEYCKLQFCNSMSTYESWDAKIKLQNTVSALSLAYNNIHYDRKQLSWLLGQDPFFNNPNIDSTYKLGMLTDIQNYSSAVAGNSGITAKSISDLVDYVLYCSDKNASTNLATGTATLAENWFPCSPDSTCRIADREWELYKGYYFELKDKYYKKLQDATTCLGQCTKIGTPIVLPVAGACPTPDNFTLTRDSASVAVNYMSLTYLPGKVSSALTVNIYYPSGVNTTGLTTSLYFNVNDVVKTFTVPVNIPVSGVHISTVVCDSKCPNINSLPQGLLDYVGTNIYNYNSDGTINSISSDPYNADGMGLVFNDDHTYVLIDQGVNVKNGTWQTNSTTCELVFDAGTANELKYTVAQSDSTVLVIETNVKTQTGYTISDIRYIASPDIWCPGGPSDIIVASPTGTPDDYIGADGMTTYHFGYDGWLRDCPNIPGYQTTAWIYGSNGCYAVQMPNNQFKYYGFKHNETTGVYSWPDYSTCSYTPKPVASSTLMTAQRSNATITTAQGATMMVHPSVSIDAVQANYVVSQNAISQKQVKLNKQKDLVSDFKTNTIYSVLYDSTGKHQLPKRKKDFKPYSYKTAFYIQIDANTYRICKNAFVAEILPEDGSENDLKIKKSKSSQTKSFSTNSLVLAGSTTLARSLIIQTITDTVTCSEALSYKISRFDNQVSETNTYAGQDTATIGSDARAAVKNAIATSCSDNADNWMKALATGLAPYSVTIRNQLRNSLISTCTSNGDTSHLNGATTTAPWRYQLRSFGDLIKSFTNITDFTPTLNPWLIESPGPYGPKQQAAMPIISSTDPAICAKLSALQALPAYSTDALLAVYLNISLADLAALKKSCTNCRFLLPYDITLPVQLDNATGCVTKADYDQAMADLLIAIPSLVTNDNDTTYRTICTNFLNQRWGFAMGYDQYKDFYTSASSGGSQTLCNQPPYTTTAGDPWECIESQIAVAVSSAERDYSTYIDNWKNDFRVRYTNTCAAAKATVDLQTLQRMYHYTLYYYDQADNLVRTIPPEGVTLLGANEQSWVDSVRDHDQVLCNYTGPATNSDKPTAITNLQTILDNTGPTAIEMWFYNGNYKALKHFVEVDPNKHYLFQGTISHDTIGVDIYPLTNSAASAITFGPTSLHYRAAMPSAMTPLPPWVHLVIQGPALGTNTALPQIFLSGIPLTVTNIPTPMDGGWTVTATAAGMIYPDSMQTLKHLRLYTRLMTPAEITANANDNCLLPSNVNQMAWYRFNVPLPGSTTTIADNSTVETQRSPVYPLHNLLTTYAYNSTNQVIHQNTPDGGNTNYWYDLLSRLTASQNDKQLANSTTTYSYTTYDNLGRIVEVGQKQGVTIAALPDYIDSAATSTFLASGTNTQITRTYYDNITLYASGMLTTATYPNLVQNNLRKRVAATIYLDNPTTLVSGLYYNYDLDGNVKSLYRQIPGLGTKQINYEYDLISGKVNFVAYQPNQPDQFYYNYAYDADNRITEAWTSPLANVINYGRGSTLDYTHKRLDAQYYYYPHGPLARMELGDVNAKVQGVDYAYTLQGWLKGVNGNAPDLHTDMGADGLNIGKDAYGYVLGYTHTDYKPIGGVSPFDEATAIFGGNLYNGNIMSSSVTIPQLGNYRQDYLYNYDQLNRLMLSHVVKGTVFGQRGGGNGENSEAFSYDENGNFAYNFRNNGDRGFEYLYKKDGNGRLLSNRLNGINVTASNTYNNTGDLSANTSYTYDPIGNLLTDSGEGITKVDWSVYGKIQNVYKGTGNINYKYDPAGNRQSKTYNGLTTYYVRDAQGNTLAVYDDKQGQVNWREQHLYGSSRIGMWTPNVMLLNNNATLVWDTIGHKQYELSNHLGNVMATISDLRTLNGTTYQPTVLNAQDYYAFGMVEPNRSYTSGGNYRYGFNGKENDNEVKGVGNQQDYGMRIYDPRVGRFLSVDPLTQKFAYYTPYQFAGNSPIKFIDLDGAEPANPDQADYKGKTGGVDIPYKASGGDASYLKNSDKLFGINVKPDQSKFFGNNKQDKLSRFVNTDSQFLVTNEDNISSQKDLVNKLVGDFVWGKGQENMVFPRNGKFSNDLKNSVSVGMSLLKWAKDGYRKSYTTGWNMNAEGQLDVLVNSGPMSLEQFLGSVSVRITQTTADNVLVEVFNVTSMTSGYLKKDIPVVNWFSSTPSSTPRYNKNLSSLNKNYQPTYSNTSQYFSFDMSTSEVDKVITQFGGGQNPYPKK